jgi:hypothetical protein
MAAKLWAAGLTAAFLVAATAPACAADDGFAAFWKNFTAALAKDDQASLAKMVALGPTLDQATPLTFARFHADHLGPKTRQCLVKAKPVHSLDGYGHATYAAFCGELIYSFYPRGGAWKLTDIDAND